MARNKHRSIKRNKRRFRGNQYCKIPNNQAASETEGEFLQDMPPSGQVNLDNSFSSTSSYSKLKGHEIADNLEQIPNDLVGNRILDISILSGVISLLCCPSCGQTSLHLSESKTKQGSARLFSIVCLCEWKHEFWSSEKTINGGFEINSRLVYAFRSLGQGFCGLERFHTLLNLPPSLTRNNYNLVSKKICRATKCVAEETMKDAAAIVHSEAMKDGNGIGNIPVSCDGSWQRRGYSSLNGIFAVISVDTGKVLDVETLCKFCKACVTNEKLKKTDPEKYEHFKASHACKSNYSGSAPNMEVTGARRTFTRSIEKNSLRYTEFYGDGDSKSFSAVKTIYPNIEILKRECIGHVQKRIGTRLRALKKNIKGIGGKGKLTNSIIDKLQNYYGISIRSNVGDLEKMKKAIHASLFHVASSEENNWHDHCPDGKESWCAFKSDKANGTSTYKPGKGLPLSVVKYVKPIYHELSDDKLLEKCLHGKTQNQNEAFNGMVWNRIPKSTYVGADQFNLGVYDAVANFNIGRKASLKVLEKLGCKDGKYTVNGCRNSNEKRLKNADIKQRKEVVNRRRQLRGQHRKREDKDQVREGYTYGPGHF